MPESADQLRGPVLAALGGSGEGRRRGHEQPHEAQRDRGQEAGTGREQEPRRRASQEDEEQRAGDGVQAENVAEPEAGMERADDQEPDQPSSVDRPEGAAPSSGAAFLQRDADPEQEREERVELAVEERVDRRRHDAVGGQRGALARARDGEAGEPGQVDEEDAQQRKAAQQIDVQETPASIGPQHDRCGSGCRRLGRGVLRTRSTV